MAFAIGIIGCEPYVSRFLFERVRSVCFFLFFDTRTNGGKALAGPLIFFACVEKGRGRLSVHSVALRSRARCALRSRTTRCAICAMSDFDQVGSSPHFTIVVGLRWQARSKCTAPARGHSGDESQPLLSARSRNINIVFFQLLLPFLLQEG